MKANLKNILKHLKPAPEQQELLKYINKELNDAAQHDVEDYINDDEFYDDAVEGLQQVSKETNLTELMQNLNQHLDKQLKSKPKKRLKKIPNQTWAIVSVLLILILMVLAFFIIKKITG